MIVTPRRDAILMWTRVHGFCCGVPEIFDCGSLSVPLCFGSAHCLADHRPGQLLSLTLFVWCGGVHTANAVIFVRLGRAARNHGQNEELTQLGVGHQDLRADKWLKHPALRADLPRMRILPGDPRAMRRFRFGTSGAENLCAIGPDRPGPVDTCARAESQPGMQVKWS